ncbi:hypothetical protein BV20DRAFT_278566 [Pilatotrama ljubarskyi]|nr:hypothetical protein BV20DRAFT_278566 [Pilatotrama ljubarskyi]
MSGRLTETSPGRLGVDTGSPSLCSPIPRSPRSEQGKTLHERRARVLSRPFVSFTLYYPSRRLQAGRTALARNVRTQLLYHFTMHSELAWESGNVRSSCPSGLRARGETRPPAR